MTSPITRQSILFANPYEIQIQQELCPPPQPDELLVQTVVSAISAGTEQLFYRGQVPPEMQIDATLDSLAGHMRYPLKYGYAAVGRVLQVGASLDANWQNKLVFAFHPHESHFITNPSQVIPVPEHIAPEKAALLPNMETAVTFVMDGAPALGERVLVVGQGIVGLLTTFLLSHFPLESLQVVDHYEPRLEQAVAFGAARVYQTLAPSEQRAMNADLVFELSGNPQALNLAIESAGFDSRVLVGSWYGQKQVPIALGGHFHRSRIRLISSQVSTIAPQHQGRWSKTRRFDVAWQMLHKLDIDQLITHRIPIHEAAQAYSLLDERPQEAIQVLLTY